MNKMRPAKNKNINWDYKSPDIQETNPNSQFQLYLLGKPEDLKKLFIEEVPYYWVHQRISKDRQFQKYLNQLNNQIFVKGFPFVDNMLQLLDSQKGNFKIICQINDLQRILEFHNDNKKLLSIYIFDFQLKTKLFNSRNKKIQIRSDDFQTFKRMLIRKQLDKNQAEIFMNATRISNWDISQVNQSRLVLKTLLVSKNDQKGKEDFVKLATVVEQQLGKVFQYEGNYKLNSTAEQAIKWYTKQSFYHRLVNNALKAGKGNPLFLSYVRFPVKQLYNAIKSHYRSKKLYEQTFECYRGGKISDKQLQYFRNNKNGFIEMQGFSSCSKSKSQISEFIVNCVFRVKVNNLQRDRQWDHGFCVLDTLQLTQFIKQEQVLFNIFSVMQIKDVTKQFFNNIQVDVVTLEYGSLAAQLYKKKNNLQIQSYQKRCINNYEALKPYYDSIQNQGDCFKFFHQYKLAQEYYSKILNHQSKQQNQNKIKLLKTYFGLGSVYMSLQQFNKAKQSYLKAKQIAQQNKDIKVQQLKLASIYNGLGLVYKNLNKIPQSKTHFLKTISLIEKSRNNQGKISLATAYNNIANIFFEQCQQEQALNYYSKALNLMQNQQNQTIANTLYNIGVINLKNQDFKSSIKSLVKSLEIYNQIFGSHKQTANTHLKLGQTYLKSNNIRDANKHFEAALDMMKQLYSSFDQEYIRVKRLIENLKNGQRRHQNKSISTSLDHHKFNDVLGMMNNKDQLSKILKGADKSVKLHTQQMIPDQTVTGSLDTFKRGSQERLRYFRGQNILNGQSPALVTKKDNGFQDPIDSKLTEFNTLDFISSLQTNRPKKRLIF